MAEAASNYSNPELARLRLLTERDHFLEHMDADGNVPAEVFDAVAQNRETAASEIAMPYAVTITEHEVVEREDETGKRERAIMWLGRTALDVAASGYKYHFSKAAHKRVPIEESEARRAQDALRPGVAQVFFSPKMTPYDASEAVAKAEHLHADDAIRVSTAIVNAQGEVVGRKLQSLLVRDIPFSAWMAMLQDSGNIFDKDFPLRGTQSATSVMELFADMDLPEDRLPEGPVTLVEAVLPYIGDELARQKVKHQLKRFRSDQKQYALEARAAGKQWAMFDLELARSSRQRYATDSLRFFIMQNAGAWTDESLTTIEACQLGSTQYKMTEELAALLARAKQKLVGDELAVATDNDRATKGISREALHQIKAIHQEILYAREVGVDYGYLRVLEQRQNRLLQRQTIHSGGGCIGDVQRAFGGDQDQAGVGETDSPFKTGAESKSGWQWKKGVCQVPACPSPKPTEVGPCSVCRHCQHEFDSGRDPTKEVTRPRRTAERVGAIALFGKHKMSIRKAPKKEDLARVA